MRKEILLACACVLCLSACGTGTKEQSKYNGSVVKTKI